MDKKYPQCATCIDKATCWCFKKGETGIFCDKCGRRLCRKKENGDCIIEGKNIFCRNGPSEGQIVAVCYHVVHC